MNYTNLLLSYMMGGRTLNEAIVWAINDFERELNEAAENMRAVYRERGVEGMMPGLYKTEADAH